MYALLKDRGSVNPDSCIKAAKNWLKEVEAKGNNAWKSKALCMLGKAQYYLPATADAEKSFQESLTYQEEINDQEIIGLDNHFLAMIRYDAEKYDDATPYFRKGIAALALTDERWTQ